MNVNELVGALAKAIKLSDNEVVGHHDPYFGGNEKKYLTQCMDEGVSGDSWVRRLEEMLSVYCGVDNVIGTSSGTAALHLALLALGVQPGDEVLAPTLTFVGTVNAIKYVGATPHFIDGTMTVNWFKLDRYLEANTIKGDYGGRVNPKTGKAIKVLIVVDLLGFPADMEKLVEIARKYGLFLVEDAAQALGASYCGKRCGSFGDVSILSFNDNKIVTGNGGGALLTNEPWIAAQSFRLATTAKVPHLWEMKHDAVGYNYRMKNTTAAMALAQLEQIDYFLSMKKLLKGKYYEVLHDSCFQLYTVFLNENSHTNNWLIPLDLGGLIDSGHALAALYASGIKARAMFTPMHLLQMYKECPRDRNLMYSEETAECIICLPSGIGLARRWG